jgi:hypothetical protein
MEQFLSGMVESMIFMKILAHMSMHKFPDILISTNIQQEIYSTNYQNRVKIFPNPKPKISSNVSVPTKADIGK